MTPSLCNPVKAIRLSVAVGAHLPESDDEARQRIKVNMLKTHFLLMLKERKTIATGATSTQWFLFRFCSFSFPLLFFPSPLFAFLVRSSLVFFSSVLSPSRQASPSPPLSGKGALSFPCLAPVSSMLHLGLSSSLYSQRSHGRNGKAKALSGKYTKHARRSSTRQRSSMSRCISKKKQAST